MSQRGRPPLQSNEAILDAALDAFARTGLQGTSVRALNATLGLSHETIAQRFGSKIDLFRAAVQHGISRFVHEFESVIAQAQPHDDLELLMAVVRALVVAAASNPQVAQLLHQPEVGTDEQTEMSAMTGLSPVLTQTSEVLHRLRDADQIRDVSMRELWFLVESSAAPLQNRDFSASFDRVDGPLEPARHTDRMVELILRSLGLADTSGKGANRLSDG